MVNFKVERSIFLVKYTPITAINAANKEKQRMKCSTKGQCVYLEKKMETFSYLFIKYGGNICQAAAVC